MIQVADNLWFGSSHDADVADVDCILNVAKDLKGYRGWPSIEYMQVGLVDGPGNPIEAYCSAVLALVKLVRTGKRVLVHCHEGKSRSVVVALMYLNLIEGKFRAEPLAWSHWLTWEERLRAVEDRVGSPLPIRPHPALLGAFARIPFGILEALV